jgi:hypothetical protein
MSPLPGASEVVHGQGVLILIGERVDQAKTEEPRKDSDPGEELPETEGQMTQVLNGSSQRLP